jgi:hypothetical protein
MRRGIGFRILLRRRYLFLPGRPRRPKMELSQRDQSFELLMQGFAADYKVRLEDSLAKGAP